MITDFLTSVAVFAAIAIVLSEVVSKWIKTNGFGAQIQSWVVAIIVAYIGNFLGFGFGTVTFLTGILYGIVVGLVANGVFDIPFTKTVLSWIKARFNPPTA